MASEDELLENTIQREENRKAAAIAEIKKKAAAMVVGESGECDFCGDESLRLVGGACARCRDAKGLD